MRRFFLSIFDLLDIASPRSVSFAECPGGTRAYLAASTDGVFYRILIVLLLVTILLGAVIGVRGTNKLISWLDSRRLDGFTQLQLRE